MNESGFRPRSVAAGAVIIGGLLLLLFPRFALSIVQVVVVTVAVVAGLHVLTVHVPPSGWMSPFKWLSPFVWLPPQRRRRTGLGEIDLIASKISGWRRPIPSGPPMPSAVLRLLRPLIRTALDLGSPQGLAPGVPLPTPPEPDLEEDPSLKSPCQRLSPLTLAVLASDGPGGPRWYLPHPPHPRQVTEVVNHVLDELERLATDPTQRGMT